MQFNLLTSEFRSDEDKVGYIIILIQVVYCMCYSECLISTSFFSAR